VKRFDYIFVGSGIAGLYIALLAKEQGSVLIITKGSIDDCNTKYAQGGIAAAIGRNDSPALHSEDTLRGGDGLCDAEVVRILVNEASDRITDLVNYGVPFDTVDGRITLAVEAAHSVPRVVHAGGDATGEHIEVSLSNHVRLSRIKVLEDCLAAEILVDSGRAVGVRAIDCRTGSVEEYECQFLILATGGAGQLYKLNTNSETATGDGIALAYKAGAEIVDMEFFQFHPTALRLPGVTPFLISEAVRGEGGVLCNVDGYRFMPDYAARSDLAPRDVVARSIIYEMGKTGSDRVFIDIRHLPPHITTTRFPHIYKFCLDRGLDITKGLVPVAPAAHYLMGGVRTNIWGETNIAGLFAAGEVACTGVHGANRLASNSMLEVLVFGKRIVEQTSQGEIIGRPIRKRGDEIYSVLSPRPSRRPVPSLSLAAVQQLTWEKVGIIRDQESLTEAAETLGAWQQILPQASDRHSYELNNLVLTGRLVAEAALVREESRGAHFRSDLPQSYPQWQRHIVFTKG